MKRLPLSLITSLPLILLWAYTVSSKLSKFRHFRTQMRRQVFPEEISEALIFIVPATEFIAAVLLCFALSRIFGFAVSAILLLAFSVYIALILRDFFGKVPCSCGGVFEQLGWGEHLIFNIVFLLLSVIGFFSETNIIKERRQ